MPHIEPQGRRRLKAKLDLDGRQIISTFGLVGPGKGLEYVIEAMPEVAARHPGRALPDRRPDPPGAAPPARRGVPQQADPAGRGARAHGQRAVREPVPRTEGHHRVPAGDRRLRDAVPRPEPDHERHVVLRARRRQGGRLHAVPARARGARQRSRAPGRVPLRREHRGRRDPDPRRPEAEGAPGEERVPLREPGHVAEERRPVPGRDGRAGRRARAGAEGSAGPTARTLQGRAPGAREPAHHAGERDAVAAGVRGDLDDQPRRDEARGRGRAAGAGRRASATRRRSPTRTPR